jgi:hypothetical protein
MAIALNFTLLFPWLNWQANGIGSCIAPSPAQITYLNTTDKPIRGRGPGRTLIWHYTDENLR